MNKLSLLKEGYGYTGVNFESNYILSNLVRSFSKDNYPVNTYSSIFGKESKDFFSHLKENKIVVEEVAKIQGLLFEKIGEKNLHEHLLHIDNDTLEILSEAVGEAFTTGAAAAKGFNFGTIKRMFSAAKNNVGGFLKNIWEQFKGLGVVQTIAPFLESGFAWVKGILGTGLDFFLQNVGALVLPAMMLFRTAPTAIAAINKN